MKKLALAILLLCPMSVAFAQTCPTTVTGSTPPINASGNTCNSASDAYSTVCGNLTTFGPTDVYLLPTFGGTVDATITVTPSLATYDVAIYLVGPNACDQATGCGTGVAPFAADDQGANTAESIHATTASGAAAGQYYLVVGSTAGANQAAGGCGTYDLSVTGTLPVKLQGFSVE